MKIIDLGLTDYNKALEIQLQTVDEVMAGGEDTLLFCSHHPVVTLGRAFKNKDQGEVTWQGEVVETSRGGKATYHGPGQIVVYPIIDLNKKRQNLKSRDLHAYLRALEDSLIESLKEFGLSAEMKETPKNSEVQMTGVWVGEQKIASIGVAVKKWVTYHGAALNFNIDPEAFQGIIPCGFSKNIMTSVEELLPDTPERADFLSVLQKIMIRNLV